MEPKNILEITDEEQIEDVITDTKTVFIFKNSTTCPISANAKEQFEAFTIKHEDNKEFTFYIINILENRPVSNRIEKLLKIEHESPQLIVLKDKKVLFHISHDEITVNEIEKQLNPN